MKVLLINGSPHPQGCTYTALSEVEGALKKNGIETELFQLGTKPVQGCMACYKCRQTGKCVVNDRVNELIGRIPEIDGMVVGSPVYYAGPAGQLTAFLDRLFFAAAGRWENTLGAAIVSCRRGGSTASFDRLNKYFTISNMPVVSSQYWNQVHGFTPEEVLQDLEGLQVMRTLGTNMAWLLKCIEAGKKAGIPLPAREPQMMTSFIR